MFYLLYYNKSYTKDTRAHEEKHKTMKHTIMTKD